MKLLDTETEIMLSLLTSETVYAKSQPRLTDGGRLAFEAGATPWIVTTAHKGSGFEKMPNQIWLGEFLAVGTVFGVFLEEVWWAA